MARQRDYAKEYQARTQRAKAEGFTGYGQRRRVSRELDVKIRAMDRQGRWEGPVPGAKSDVKTAMIQAEAIIMGYSKKTQLRAEERGVSLLARTKKGRAIREILRKAFGWKKKKGEYGYYPMMRTLYPPRTVSRHS